MEDEASEHTFIGEPGIEITTKCSDEKHEPGVVEQRNTTRTLTENPKCKENYNGSQINDIFDFPHEMSVLGFKSSQLNIKQEPIEKPLADDYQTYFDEFLAEESLTPCEKTEWKRHATESAKKEKGVVHPSKHHGSLFCDVCDKHFYDPKIFINHIQSHSTSHSGYSSSNIGFPKTDSAIIGCESSSAGSGWLGSPHISSGTYGLSSIGSTFTSLSNAAEFRCPSKGLTEYFTAGVAGGAPFSGSSSSSPVCGSCSSSGDTSTSTIKSCNSREGSSNSGGGSSNSGGSSSNSGGGSSNSGSGSRNSGHWSSNAGGGSPNSGSGSRNSGHSSSNAGGGSSNSGSGSHNSGHSSSNAGGGSSNSGGSSSNSGGRSSNSCSATSKLGNDDSTIKRSDSFRQFISTVTTGGDTYKKESEIVKAAHDAISKPVSKPLQCDTCGKYFRLSCNLSTHKRIHTGERPFECIVCHKTFSDKSNFNQHNNSHLQLRKYQCEVCCDTFTRLTSLRRHSARAHDLPMESNSKYHKGGAHNARRAVAHPPISENLASKSCTCEVCGQELVSTRSLQMHRTIHVKKTHMCNTCGKLFHHEEGLKAHVKHHLSVRPFNCDVCGKGFTERRFLTRHLKIHNRIKPRTGDT